MINANILRKHAQDAAFFWLRRDAAVRTNHYTLTEQLRLDGRVEANLDGLIVAEDAGWDACASQLAEYPEAGEVFAAGAVALHSLNEARFRQVIESAYRDDSCARALVSALGVTPFERIEPLLTRWLGANSAFESYLGVAGCAVHRRDPGAVLERLLVHPSARVQRRAVRAAAELGRSDLVALLRELAQDPGLALDASLSLSLLRCADAHVLGGLERAVNDSVHGWSAAGLLTALAPEASHERIAAWSRAGQTRAALAGIEASGDLRWMPELIRWMGDDSVSRVAGDVFRSLTGVDLDYEDLERDPPSAPDTDVVDAEVSNEDGSGPRLYAEQELSWPAELSVARWWRAHRDEFAPGLRYLAGHALGPCTETQPDAEPWTRLCTLASSARPRQRALAAQQLKLARPELASVETHAFVGRSRESPGLAGLRAAPTRERSVAETESA